MDDQHLLDELLHAAARLAVSVRMEPFETPATQGGGLCIVRGETLVLIDQRAPPLSVTNRTVGNTPEESRRAP